MSTAESRQYDLEVAAGHCSLNPEKLAELYAMSEIQVSDGKGGRQRALSAVRWIGLKSRTNLGSGMGMDYKVIEEAILRGGRDGVPPSVLMAESFVRETGMGVAAEIMVPGVQMPYYEGRIPKGKFMPWNASVNQLGWNIMEMAQCSARNGWTVGIKNGKWLGVPYNEGNIGPGSSMEKTWLGLASFAKAAGCEVAFIHRGVDVPEKGDFRNALVHEVVKHLAISMPEARRYFDPSHSLGPRLRNQIVPTTIEAMRMKVGNDWLYTGILIEAGTSETDTDQHVTVDELGVMLNEISRFRILRGPLPLAV